MSVTKRFSFKTWDDKDIPVYEIGMISEVQKEALNKRFIELYGTENQRKKADIRYNCHGMTFVGKLGWVGCYNSNEDKVLVYNTGIKTDNILAEQDAIEEILHGNKLRRTARINNLDLDNLSGEDIKIGDIAIYKNIVESKETITHTAIVIEVAYGQLNKNEINHLRVLSKMGPGGEYFHHFKTIPWEFGKIIEIWTDRK